MTTPQVSQTRWIALIDDLLKEAAESPWLEFKHDNANPERIGQLISAVANGARLADKPFGYVVWGVENGTHRVVGTAFEPATAKKGGDNLSFWLSKTLEPSPAFDFRTIQHPNGRVVLLEIPPATVAPVKFQGDARIRIGDATPLLADFPDRERQLWTKLQPTMWERGVAAQFVSSDDVLEWLDYPSYFTLTGQPLPDNRQGILARMAEDGLIAPDVGDRWNILNLGAILFAKRLDRFDRLARKAVRVIQYEGVNRVKTKREQPGGRGYAAGFEGLIGFIDAQLPRNEHIGQAFRVDHAVFPEIAIRELTANALIHQDMTIAGTGPMVELFDDRIEITNPGAPLIDVRKFIGSPPRSRNEALAALMRRMRICEERGSGIIKVLTAVELFQLPAPDFRALDDNTRVILYAPRKFRDMDAGERIRACYQHAALRYVTGERMTNASFRHRLGIEERNSAQVSRVIRDCLNAGAIRVADPVSPRTGYVPFWA